MEKAKTEKTEKVEGKKKEREDGIERSVDPAVPSLKLRFSNIWTVLLACVRISTWLRCE